MSMSLLGFNTYYLEDFQMGNYILILDFDLKIFIRIP